jgi:hypothetical protein
MKLKSSISEFLKNKWVLNVVTILSVLNIIGYISLGNVNAVLFFILFAVLIRYFSKNMTIVLGLPLIIINLFSFQGNMIEGMDNKDPSTNDVSTNDVSTNDVSTNDDKKDEIEVDISDTLDSNKTSEDNEQQGFETGRRKNRGHNIDYATTVEDAYDELNNKLGSEGIQRLTADTQNLIEKQMKLAKTMEGMNNLVKSIQPMVGQLHQIMGPSK